MKYLVFSFFILSTLFGFSQDKPLKSREVPFAVVETVPIYPGCEKKKGNINRKKCMSEKVAKFVNSSFNQSVVNKTNLSGKQRISVIFKINTEGNVSGVRARASHPVLKKEAIRVVKDLPKMIPGMQDGEIVTVPYSLPIIFMIKSRKTTPKT